MQTLLCLVCLFAVSGCVVHTYDGDAEIGRESQSGEVYLGWHLFKKKAKRDKEIYSVGKSHGKFRAVRLVTSNAPVKVKRVIVTFGNGERFEPKVRKKMGKDASTRWIDLPGGKRNIHNVTIVARSTSKLLAKIEVLGRR